MGDQLRRVYCFIPHDVIFGGEIIVFGGGEIVHLFTGFVDFYLELWQVEDFIGLIFSMGLADPSRPPELNLHILNAISAAPGALNVGLRREGTQDIAYAHWLNRPGDPDVRKVEMGLMKTLNGAGEEQDGQTSRSN